MNENDGVVMFIRDDVVKSTNVIVVNNLSILHFTIKLDEKIPWKSPHYTDLMIYASLNLLKI